MTALRRGSGGLWWGRWSWSAEGVTELVGELFAAVRLSRLSLPLLFHPLRDRRKTVQPDEMLRFGTHHKQSKPQRGFPMTQH